MIIFRVDGDEIIGSGHIMRCLSLAKNLRLYKVEILFILTNTIFKDLIENEDFECKIIEGFSRDFAFKQEILYKELDKYECALVIVDSYFITKQFIVELNSKYKVFLISDKNELEAEYKQICVLNYNIYMNDYKSTRYRLNGTKYALLREEFHYVQYQKKKDEILILSGGSDPYNVLTLFVQQLLEISGLMGYKFTVITSRLNPNLDKLEKINNSRVTVVVNTNEISKYMTRAKVAISAGGNTVYELCACGTQCITYSCSDIQVELCKAFERYYPYIGDVRYDMKRCISNLLRFLTTLIENDLLSYHNTLKNVCDGKGGERVAKYIVEKYLKDCTD